MRHLCPSRTVEALSGEKAAGDAKRRCAAVAAPVQRDYALGSVLECRLLRTLANDVDAVTATAGQYVLKVYGHGRRSYGEVAWEVELLVYLARQGLSVPTALPRVDGQAIGTAQAPAGPRQMVLFPHAEGRKPEAPSVALYRPFGRTLAEIHRASDDFATEWPRQALDLPYLLDRALDIILPHLSERPADAAYVGALADRTRQRIAALAGSGLDWGVCHGDVSLDNIHVTPGGQLVVYDFDSAGPGWRASDPWGVMTWVTRG